MNATPPTHVVGPDDSAAAVGSGDVTVLATPRLIAWMEAATVAASPDIGADSTTVGTRVDVTHLLASPLGAAVTVDAHLAHSDGRLLRFEVTAFHDVGAGPVLVAQGHITRVTVDRARFLARNAPSRIIRRVLPEEFDFVGDLSVDAYGAVSGPDSDSYSRVLLDVARRSATGEVLVALDDGHIVGTVMLCEAGSEWSELARPGECEFRFMAVSREAWRGGIGRALVSAVIDRSGGRAVVCSVLEGNEPARALYVSLGFEADPDRDHQPAPGVRLAAYLRPPS